MVILEIKKIPGGLLAGIVLSTILAAMFGKIELPKNCVSFAADISAVAFKLDIVGAFKWSMLGSIFTLMFMDMFDSIGTLVACCNEAQMVDEDGSIENLDRLLSIDAGATMAGAVLGTSTTTSYIESAAGIEQGGRSGISSIVTGLLFLLAIIFCPLVGIVPSYATGGALIMVGAFMMKEVRKIDFVNIEQAFPAFVIMIMIALSYSISTGLAFGFICFAGIKIVTAKARELGAVMWIIVILCTMFVTMDYWPRIIEFFKF